MISIGLFENIVSNIIANKIGKNFRIKIKKFKKVTVDEDRYRNAFRFFYETSYENLYLEMRKITQDEFNELEQIIEDVIDDKKISTFEIKWTLFRNIILKSNSNKNLIELLYKVEELLNINFSKKKPKGK